MRANRTRPVRLYNRRARRLQQHFAQALWAKEHRCTREEEFEALYAPLYRDYGRRVGDADRARRLREADKAHYLGHADAEVHIVDGRIVIASGGRRQSEGRRH